MHEMRDARHGPSRVSDDARTHRRQRVVLHEPRDGREVVGAAASAYADASAHPRPKLALPRDGRTWRRRAECTHPRFDARMQSRFPRRTAAKCTSSKKPMSSSSVRRISMRIRPGRPAVDIRASIVLDLHRERIDIRDQVLSNVPGATPAWRCLRTASPSPRVRANAAAASIFSSQRRVTIVSLLSSTTRRRPRMPR